MSRAMPAAVRAGFDAELEIAQAAKDNDAAWAALERARIPADLAAMLDSDERGAERAA